jgi:septation ring formation regulator EzrA
MGKEHFEVILERIQHNTELMLEGFSGMNQRFDRLEGRVGNVEERLDRVEVAQEVTNRRLHNLEEGQAKLEQGQVEIKSDVREIKRTVGLLQTIASDHETRIQSIEST